MTQKRKPEPTQVGNPRQITIEQHVHSRWCIERFAGDSGKVSVLRADANVPFLTSPANPIFCAQRVWDERVEHGLFKRVEDAFHDQVDALLDGKDIANHRTITEYLAVWDIRAHLRDQPPGDEALRGIVGSDLLTKDEEEVLETKHVSFLRDGALPGRMWASLVATRRFQMFMVQYGDISWAAVHGPQDVGFLCPDSPNGEAYIPISRRMALVAKVGDLKISASGVDEWNRSARLRSRRLVFGHPADIESFLARD